ncbi:hypothetical protein N665_0103s0039 [Sinapis alba]|nr:hypothetical protein N665_0103s0039 [Sinapis alba]
MATNQADFPSGPSNLVSMISRTKVGQQSRLKFWPTSLSRSLQIKQRSSISHNHSNSASAVSNNEAKYEASIAGLCLAKVVGAKRLQAFCDSQLVASQYSGDYEAKNERMDAYLGIVRNLAAEFDHFELTKVPRKDNCFADALAALGSNQQDQVRRTIPIHTVENPSMTLPLGKDVLAISSTLAEITTSTAQDADWRTPFLDYLDKGILPEDKWESRRLKEKSSNYVSINGKLHRWTANKVVLTCVGKKEAELVMIKTHEGEGGNLSGGRALALKLKSQGHYWPTMVTDSRSMHHYARNANDMRPTYTHQPSF